MSVTDSDNKTGTVVCFVRHGETDWNLSGRLQGRENTPLNETGLAQARLTGLYLARWSWDAVITSPLERAAKSAEIIAETIGAVGLRHMPDLVERDYGEMAGLTNAEIAVRWPGDSAPGVETRDSVLERGRGALAALALEFAGKRVIVVSHGGFINTVLSLVSKGEIGSGKTTLANACVSMLRHEDGRWVVEEYNATAHLALG